MDNDSPATITTAEIAQGAITTDIQFPPQAYRDLHLQAKLKRRIDDQARLMEYDPRTNRYGYTDPYGYARDEERARAMEVLGITSQGLQVAMDVKNMKDGDCLTIECDSGVVKMSKHEDPDGVYADIIGNVE